MIGVSVWSVVEPLTVDFKIDVPVENCKPQKRTNYTISKAKAPVSREQVAASITKLVTEQKLDISEISERLNVSLSTVRRVCRTRQIGNYSARAEGIVSRSSQVPFGWDTVQGRLQRNSAEWKWVEEIHRLHSSGTSLNKIADTLNSKNVATKRGSRWFAKTVSQTLKFNSQHISQPTNKRRK